MRVRLISKYLLLIIKVKLILMFIKSDYQSQTIGNQGLWYFVDYKSQSDKTIFFVDYKSQADLLIYFVDYKSQAKWNKKSKIHLLY